MRRKNYEAIKAVSAYAAAGKKCCVLASNVVTAEEWRAAIAYLPADIAALIIVKVSLPEERKPDPPIVCFDECSEMTEAQWEAIAKIRMREI